MEMAKKSNMINSGNRPAGGLGSRVINPQGQRLGQAARGVSPGAVSQLDEGVGNHVSDGAGGRTSMYRGEGWFDGKTPAGGNQRLGNQLTNNVGKGGPGTGRVIYTSGSQSGVSPTRSPNASTKDTLAEYGPDTANARNRR
jgi:hypothetical protein